MNERQPPLSIQFSEGYKAFRWGMLTNKYDVDTAKGKEWQRGFNAAYFKNLDYRKRSLNLRQR